MTLVSGALLHSKELTALVKKSILEYFIAKYKHNAQ
jgi:hypothetical protein